MDARSSKAVADSVLDTVPSVMQFIRSEMRRHGARGISVPQFRVLNFLGRRPGGSLSDAAERVGLSLPATSRLVDGLVERGLLSRGESSLDRRRVTLQLTPRGQELLRTARAGTQAALSDTLASLPPEKRAVIVEALEALRPLFVVRPPKDSPR